MMSLFPAYVDSRENRVENEVEVIGCTESLALEAQLLASDNDEEQEPSIAAAAPTRCMPESPDYYIDCNLDFGNMRVSTLYYPGRPQYESPAPRCALGAVPRGGAARARRRRYYEVPRAPAPSLDGELAQRTRAFRDLLADAPHDEPLWLRFIEFQERSRDADAALSAASEAAARLPASSRVRAALHRARARALAPHARLALLRADLAAADSAPLSTELWLRLLDVASAAGGAELDAAARAALAATRSDPAAYPHILYVYGGYLRAAGLWERLVLLLELVATMNFPPAAFPPPLDEQRLAQQERDLLDLEDKAINSGLPLSTVWVRVERARAAAHWRAPPARGALSADPQRAPLSADVADLLLPAASPRAAALLLAHALRLAKVPLLPAAQHALAAADAAHDALGDARAADGGEALLALLRAARRLPPAHPARAARATCAAALAHFLDPPHYFTDDAGFLSWVTSLWDASCTWTAGADRVAMLCWRLRWLHALVLLLEPHRDARELRRVRGEARAALKRFAGASPLPFVQFARIEHAAADASAARRTALHALRAALRDDDCPPHHRLYVARVTGEVCDEEATSGAWATVCAALGLALPPDSQLSAPPPGALVRRALQQCEQRCAALERQGAAAPADVLGAMLPAEAEWAAARARLACPARRAALVCAVRAAADCPANAAAARYWEQSACALVTAAARDHRLAQYARALAPLFPHNALLALACSGAPLWAWEKDASQEERLRAITCSTRTHTGALAHVLPPLLRAVSADWQPREAERVAAASARAGRAGAGGALLHAVRLEAEARAEHARPHHALYAALDAQPQHKWLAVRGAAWCSAQTAALADVLLERQLRAHALLDELVPASHRT